MRKLCIAPESNRAEIAKFPNCIDKNTKSAEVCSSTKLKLPVWGVGVAFGTELGALLPPGGSKLHLRCSVVLGSACPYISRSGAKGVPACIVEPRG